MLPWERERELQALGLPAYDAGVLTENPELAQYALAIAAGADPKLASNWLMNEVLRVLKERGWSARRWSEQVPPARMREFLAAVARRELPGPLAKQAFGWLAEESGDLAELLKRHGVRVQSSSDELAPLVRRVIEEHPGPVQQYRAGKTATLGFLVGQVMKHSGGQAVPQLVQELLRRELDAPAAKS